VEIQDSGRKMNRPKTKRGKAFPAPISLFPPENSGQFFRITFPFSKREFDTPLQTSGSFFGPKCVIGKFLYFSGKLLCLIVSFPFEIVGLEFPNSFNFHLKDYQRQDTQEKRQEKGE